jgi:hypothetical protein
MYKAVTIFCLCLVLASSAAMADGDIQLTIPIGGHVDFNLGPVASVSIAEVHFIGTNTHSNFDCDGEPLLAAPGLYVHFDDEGLVTTAPFLSYPLFAGPFDLTLGMSAPDPGSWDIIDDGVARIYAEMWIHETTPGCTLVTPGTLAFDEDTVTVHLVYTSLVAADDSTWGTIKAMYK